MITKILNTEQLKQIFIESLLGKTNEVTKISEGSVLNGVAYGVGKLGQKVLKDVAVVEAHLFPDSAYGVYLDKLADLRGVAARLGATKSSTYMLLRGDAGTIYTIGTHVFSGNNGVDFDLEDNITLNAFGYAYAKVSSSTTGANTNVDGLTLNKVTPVPAGHKFCVNEYTSLGGTDAEDDELFRKRIKEEINLLARNTLSYLEQVLRKINASVLRCYNYGLDNNGDLNIAIAHVSGADFTAPELNQFIVLGEKYFSMNELRPSSANNSYGIKFVNVVYFPIDVSFRVDIDNTYDVDEVRKNIQISMSKLFDYRFWDSDLVEWVDLLNAVRNTAGVRRALDNHFTPIVDITIPKNQIPRIRGFIMLNLAGAVITNLSGTLSPVFYPAEADFSFRASVLRSI